MNIKTNLIAVGVASSLLWTSTAVMAGADSGFYIGAGVGNATTSLDIADEPNFDESDTAYKLFGGYNIGFIPLVDFAVEASYVDFGSPGDDRANVDVSGLDAFGLAGLSFGPFGIFAKAGVIKWDTNSNAGDDSGTDPAYGLGARFALGSFSVRAEYELFDLGDVDVDMVSISGVYTF